MRRLLWMIFLPCFAFSLSYQSDAQHVDVESSILKLPSEIKLNEKAALEIEIILPEGYALHSVSHEHDQSAFSWSQHSDPQVNTVEDKLKWHLTLPFEPQLVGDHYLNLPTLHFKNETDFVTLYPPLTPCTVIDPKASYHYQIKEPLPLDARQPIEISSDNKMRFSKQNLVPMAKPTIIPELSIQKAIKWVLIALMLCFVIWKIYNRYLKQWINRSKADDATVDPVEKALTQLQQLDRQKLIQKGYFEEFYVTLTAIVRQYIESRYQIKAPEQTTQEFLTEVLKTDLFGDQQTQYLKDFLQFADLVKFAKLHPEVKDCMQAKQLAENFIQSSGNQKGDDSDAV